MPEEEKLDWGALDDAVTGSTHTLTDKVREKAKKTEAELDGHQRRKLRYWIAGSVVLVLSFELWGMFMIVVWQGRGHFKLNEWMFSILTNGVLIQTFLGFRTIITHLFPVDSGVLPSDKK